METVGSVGSRFRACGRSFGWRAQGFPYWVLGFRILGFRILGFRVLGFTVLGFRVLGFRVSGF